jgi:hypothetical protein
VKQGVHGWAEAASTQTCDDSVQDGCYVTGAESIEDISSSGKCTFVSLPNKLTTVVLQQVLLGSH